MFIATACRCLFIVIPYNRINLNHDRINLNLVGGPRGPLVIALTLPYVRYATVHCGYIRDTYSLHYQNLCRNFALINSKF